MDPTPPGTPAAPTRSGTLLLIGTLAGVYSGLFGVGGGSVMVPLLILWLAYDPREATATSLAAITVIATAGAITHALYGNVAWTAAVVVAVPAVLGAPLGAALQQRVPREWLTIGLAVLLVVGAVDLLRGHEASSAASATALGGVVDPVWLGLAGFVAGVLGGMVGIGGGILVVPVLIYTQDFAEVIAIATSLAAMVPMSLTAAWRHHRYGNLRLRQGVQLGVLGIVGAAAGASLADVLPQDVLRIGFAVVMLLIAWKMLRDARREMRAAAATAAT